MPHPASDIQWWRDNITIDNPQGKPGRIVIRFPEPVDLRHFGEGVDIVVVPRSDTEPPPTPHSPPPST